MRSSKITLLCLTCLLCTAGMATAASVSVGLSGPGAVNDSTIKVGEKVSVDILIENEDVRKGFALGFRILSDDIKAVLHPADSGAGLNDRGDIKGHNGWNDASVWDFNGVYVVEDSWDGALPDTVGFGGLNMRKEYGPHELARKLSFDLVVPTEGVIVIDSSFYPPGGKWMFSAPSDIGDPSHFPEWGGPYKFKVVK